jgi:hypothetical protein
MDDDDGDVGEPGNPLIELGELMSVPSDHATRRSYLETEFELFERADMRLYHHVNGLFVLFLAKQHPLYEHPLRASAKLVYTKSTLGILEVTGKKRKGEACVVFFFLFLLSFSKEARSTSYGAEHCNWSC